eukprot:jgi/Chlat1/6466/Chrsp45S05976
MAQHPHVEGVTHEQLDLSTGISMHVAAAGDPTAPVAVVLVHGFPELWFSWRHQLPALAKEGYRVYAPDMRGYGGTSAPHAVSEYTQEKIADDIVALLNALKIDKAVLIGHDWGGKVVWNMAVTHPDRVLAVGGLNTPYSPPPPIDPIEALKMQPGNFDYMLYFQEEGVAEKEFEADVERTFMAVIRSAKEALKREPAHKDDDLIEESHLDGSKARARGGLLVGLPAKDQIAPTSMMTKEELDYFVSTYARTGFRGGLNWYRTFTPSWEWIKTFSPTINVPALMVTAGKDTILTPAMTEGMEQWIPKLERAHIEESSHWTQNDYPEEVNRILIDWLQRLQSQSKM